MRLRRTLIVLGLVSLVTSAVWFTFESPATGIDDANIFFAYARNISAGKGFVFNAGGEHVEGFTSLLWVLICSAAVTIAGEPERLLLALNVALVSLTVVACIRRLPAAWAALFVALLLTDFSYVAWNTVTLMETALWGALLTLASLIIVEERERGRRTWVFAAIVALMVLARPEALIWAPVMIALFYLRYGSPAPAVIAYVVTAMALTIFRVLYFGYPLPNTYYAKVSPSLVYSLSGGSTYLQSYILSGPIPFASAVAIVISTLHVLHVRFKDHTSLALGVLAFMGLLVPVVSGGDHFDGFRFYQSAYPLLVLNLVHCARTIVPSYASRVTLRIPYQPALRLAAVAVLLGGFLSLRVVEWMFVDHRAMLGYEFDIAKVGRVIGREANGLFDGDEHLPTIGTITVGGLKYAYDGDVIDLMGLNNTRMAHNGGARIGLRSHAAFEKHTFYELEPMLLVPLVQFSGDLSTLEAGNPVTGVALTLMLKGLLNDEQFRRKYQLAEVRKVTPEGEMALAAWYDRNYLDGLKRSGEFQIVTRP